MKRPLLFPKQAGVLAEIQRINEDQGRGAGQLEIAKTLGVAPQAIFQALGQLMRRHLVTTGDIYERNSIHITKEGERALEDFNAKT